MPSRPSINDQLILQLFEQQKKPLTIQEIQRLTNLPRTTVQKVLERLWIKNLIEQVGKIKTKGRPRKLYQLTS